jgi:hypothetical protein
MNKKYLPAVLALLTLPFLITGCGGSDSDSDSDTQAEVIDTDDTDVTVVDEDGTTNVDPDLLLEQLASMPVGELTAQEEAGLLYMREEEKLAYDVYLQMDALWQQKIFTNIAAAELTHTASMLALLDRYAVADPVGSNAVGVFEDQTLQGLYDLLVATGSSTLIDGLLVGAEIEEIDLIDIDIRKEELIDNEDIELVYENLMKGSRNHLRAFVKALDAQGFTYTPQHLSVEEYEEIIGSPVESGPV